MKNTQDFHPNATKRYFFILGREAHLAVAELMAVLEREAIAYTIVTAAREVLIVDMPDSFPPALFHELGGMIKFGECLFEASSVDRLPLAGLETVMSGEKAIFGFSVYPLVSISVDELRRIKRSLDHFALTFKKELKLTVPRVRYAVTKELAMSSVAVLTNKLMRDGGYEFVVLAKQPGLIIGRTLAVQDFSGFRHRDFGRPARDPKRGTLPPKLARVLINLAGAPKQGTLLDPFCGDGTVLTEAIALGYSNLVGSDIDAAAVRNTEANTNWCTKEYQQNADVRLFAADVRTLPDTLPPQSIDAIVAEGDLGAPLRERLSREEAGRAVEAKSILYRDAINALAPLLKRGGKMVLALPHFPTTAGEFGISFAGLNFEAIRLAVATSWPAGISPEIGRFGQMGSYIYGREDQKVEREIFIFEKK